MSPAAGARAPSSAREISRPGWGQAGGVESKQQPPGRGTDRLTAQLSGQLVRPRPHHQAVVGLLHHRPSNRDGMADALDRRHPARRQGPAVHDHRVHLHVTLVRQHGAAAGVEDRVVLHRADRRLHGVQRWAARRQHGPARRGRLAHARQRGRCVGRRDGPGPAVQQQHRQAPARGRHTYRCDLNLGKMVPWR